MATAPKQQSELLRAALAYAKRGWRVLPCWWPVDGKCACGGKPGDCKPGKHPIPDCVPHGVSNATTEADKIKRWWGKYPQANIGIAAGAESGLIITDCDSEDAFRKWRKRLGIETLRAKSGRPGRFHEYLLHPKDGRVIPHRDTFDTDTEVKSDGGQGKYVIAPPSLHVNGKRYEWALDKPVQPAPEWLIAELIAPPRSPAKSKPADTTVTEGQRNNRLHKMASMLRGQGWELESIEASLLAFNQNQCDPPLPEEQVLGIARRGSGYEPNPPEDESLLIIGQPPLAKRIAKIGTIFTTMPICETRMFYMPGSRRFVHIPEYRQTDADKNVTFRDPSAPVLDDVNRTFVCVMLSESGKVRALNKKGELIEADPTLGDAEAFIEVVTKGRSPLPVLRMVSTSPVLLPDGTIISEPGYHEQSQIWLHTRGKVFDDPNPDETLSASQCRELIDQEFSHFFEECAFVREHPDQPFQETESFAVLLSGALSIALCNLLPCRPAHCISAPAMAQRSGKTYSVQLATALVTGLEPTSVSYDGSSEFGKALLPLLEAGDRSTVVENIDRVVNNNRLATALTQPGLIRWRELGKSKVKTVENSTVFWFEGNGLELTGDMPPRCVMGFLDSGMERPEDRQFRHRDALTDAKHHHPRAVMALLRAARAHMRAEFAGAKMLEKPMGGFAEYSQWVRGLLVWMGFADPKATQARIRESDPGRTDSVEVL